MCWTKFALLGTAFRKVADVAAVDDRMADFGASDHGCDFVRAEQRHGRDDYASGFQYSEPRSDHRIAVGAAQKHAVAWDQLLFLDQQPCNAGAEIVELSVGPGTVSIDHRE